MQRLLPGPGRAGKAQGEGGGQARCAGGLADGLHGRAQAGAGGHVKTDGGRRVLAHAGDLQGGGRFGDGGDAAQGHAGAAAGFDGQLLQRLQAGAACRA